jgi:hypothetical protein
MTISYNNEYISSLYDKVKSNQISDYNQKLSIEF